MKGNLMQRLRFISLGFLIMFAGLAWGQAELPYERTVDAVYLEEGDTKFYMDVFVPNGKGQDPFFQPNENGYGLGIIDIASGAWHSDRGKIGDHETAQVYNILCARGYTVFAVRPGTRPKYTALQMVDHLKHAIRYVKHHAKEYNIDPDKLGLTGASAGGHLALLTSLTSEPAQPDADDPLLQYSTDVAAVGVFFPPTNFLDWEGKSHEEVRDLIGDILFVGGAQDRPMEEVLDAAKKASPFFHVSKDAPPFIFFHGDADPVVPLQQSEIMVEKLKEAGHEARLVVKPGGTHPWITIPFEVIKMADWFDAKLAGVKKEALATDTP
jgi:acetyl esterase/lipase